MPPSHHVGSGTLEHFSNVKLMWVVDLPIILVIGLGSMQVVVTNRRVPGGRSMMVGFVVCGGGFRVNLGATLG